MSKKVSYESLDRHKKESKEDYQTQKICNLLCSQINKRGRSTMEIQITFETLTDVQQASKFNWDKVASKVSIVLDEFKGKYD